MNEPSHMNRLVYQLGGFDTIPPAGLHRRISTGVSRFAKTWSIAASVTEPEIEQKQVRWRINASGPNWRSATELRIVRWDDIIEAVGARPPWTRVLRGWIAFGDFVVAGALWGYLRANWRYALFFLYPFCLFGAILTTAVLVAGFVAPTSGWAAGGAEGAATFLVLFAIAARRFFLLHLMDDWSFSQAYVGRGDIALNTRLDGFAQELVTAAREQQWDEILIVGHSLGAVLAIDLLNRSLCREPTLGAGRPSIVFLSIGSSILKIGLHRGAKKFRAELTRVASATGIFWGEYQAVSDLMNFYKTDPISLLNLASARHPVVRVVRISRMLQPETYRRIRRSFFRQHNQFVSGNDRRAAYDYFMLLCGPLKTEAQVLSRDGAIPAISPEGAVVKTNDEQLSPRNLRDDDTGGSDR